MGIWYIFRSKGPAIRPLYDTSTLTACELCGRALDSPGGWLVISTRQLHDVHVCMRCFDRRNEGKISEEMIERRFEEIHYG